MVCIVSECVYYFDIELVVVSDIDFRKFEELEVEV